MKNLFLFFACSVIIFTSCSEDSENLPKNTNEKVITKSSNIEDNQMLQFENMDSFKATLNKLKSMSKEEVLSWSKANEFVSMYKLFTEVDSRIDNVKDAEEYKNLRKEYSSTFIFNDEDYYDLTMYLPTKDWEYSKIINTQGEVMIGGEIHSFKDLQNYNDYKTANGNTMSGSLEDQEITVFADEIVINQCGLTSNHKKRKFHVKSNWDSLRGCVAFSLNASSKFLWGWKALSTKYYCTGLGPQYKPLWETNEMPSGSTYWVPNFPRSGDFYIYTRSFGPEGRQLLRVRV